MTLIDFDDELEKAASHTLSQAKIKQALVKQEVSSLEKLPKFKRDKHGALDVVRIDGIGLTSTGVLTRTDYFSKMDMRKEIYGELAFTKEEADKITRQYKKLATGPNSVMAMVCTANLCPFAFDCPYQQIGKAPVGLACLLEYDLLDYHSRRFIEQFDIQPEDHSDMLLVQELSELTVYEMRLARILASPDHALLYTEEIKTSVDGTVTVTEKEHWALAAKAKIKKSRLQVLDALIGTRKSKLATKLPSDQNNNSYGDFLKTLHEKIEAAKIIEAQDVTYTERTS